MFALARKAKFHLLLYRHDYLFTEKAPSVVTMKMLTSLCRQADEDARPGASMVVYATATDIPTRQRNNTLAETRCKCDLLNESARAVS